MSRYHQLLGITVLLWMLLFSIISSLHVYLLRIQLAEQQTTHILHSITLAGLALTPHLEISHSSAAEKVVHTLFETGHYQAIELQIFANEHKIYQQLPVAPSKVPHWLRQLGWFETGAQQHVITSGWLQLAKLTLVANTESLYQQLWYQMRYLAIGWFISLLGVAGLLHLTYVRFIGR